jgi:hypothetical protein
LDYLKIIFFLFTACAAPQIQLVENKQKPSVPVVSEELSAEPSLEIPVVEAEPTVEPHDRRVILVFPQQKLLSFFAVGVLKVFSQNQIPLRAIIATDLSAVISFVFLKSRTLNQFDWYLAQMALCLPQTFFYQLVQKPSAFKAFLDQQQKSSFQKDVPLYLVSPDSLSYQQVSPDQSADQSADLLLANLYQKKPVPPVKWKDLIDQIKKETPLDPVVFVSFEPVHSDYESLLLPKEARLMSPDDYTKRSSLIYFGKKAALKSLSSLKKAL